MQLIKRTAISAVLHVQPVVFVFSFYNFYLRANKKKNCKYKCECNDLIGKVLLSKQKVLIKVTL